MNDIDLDALEATARAATPGPWKYPHRNYPDMVTTKHGCLWNPGTGRINDETDAQHIATFDPTTALTLIARLREAEAVIGEIRANAVELLDADDDSYDGSMSAIWAVELIDAYKTTKTEGNEP